MWRAILIVSAIASLFYITEIREYDIWWHLATGRWIVENLAIPAVDSFSFTLPGAPLSYVNSFADVVLYLAYAAFGAGGMALINVVASFARLVLIASALRQAGVKLVIPVLLALAFLVQARFTLARPMVIGSIWVAAGTYLCMRWASKPDRSILLFLPLAFLWVHTHGSAVVVMTQLGVLCGDALFRKISDRDRAQLLVSVAGAAAMFAFFKAGQDVYRIAFIDFDPQSMIIKTTAEMHPFQLSERHLWMPAFLIVASALISLPKLRARLIPLGLAAVGMTMSLRFARNLNEACVLSAPLWGLALDDVAGWLEKKKLSLMRSLLPVLFPAAVMLIHIGVMPWKFLWNHNYLNLHLGTGIGKNKYPVEALEFLRTLPPGRTLNDPQFGGYLTWNHMPGGIFIDSRNYVLFHDDFLDKNYFRPSQSPVELERVADRYEIVYGLVAWDHAMGLNMMTSPQWIPIYHCGAAVIFIRAKHAARLDPRPLGTVRYVSDQLPGAAEWIASWYDSVLATPEGRAALERELEVARRQCPESPVLQGALRYLETR